ncbi:GDSL-type esterase/lipase family protein [Lewinella sp. 4G2]|uniref:SGNH/GDSL hydrolase family protein n=1 Tax=Lewinella sp. 4G2 TaxID=1803372 RepID=UPI0007B48C7F|nr:GDSL-type esterase/lipase family protein [Lewinella sp. 4G2]OAV44465.1 hypothetical protein A3850_008165 [Lewinella sp. 4G2]
MIQSLRLGICLLCGLLLTTCSVPLSEKSLLVIGDSNGERKGWVYQLQDLREGGPLVNTSISGNTVGFSYGGSELRTNTLENLTNYLRKGYAEMGKIDEILIGLGTNDCKVEFRGQESDVATNLETLLDRTAAFFTERGQKMPRIVILSPPPLNDVGVMPLFADATACVKDLTERYRKIATERGHCFVDLQANPGPSVLEYSKDGIHFSREGYVMIARSVLDSCY